MRERVDLKSPVRENRPPGSVRGAPGNRRSLPRLFELSATFAQRSLQRVEWFHSPNKLNCVPAGLRK
jgi:hypothetical protein